MDGHTLKPDGSVVTHAQPIGTRPELKIQYDVVDLEDVVRYFVRGYQKDKGEIEHHEWFVDSAKGKLIVKLYVRGGA